MILILWIRTSYDSETTATATSSGRDICLKFKGLTRINEQRLVSNVSLELLAKLTMKTDFTLFFRQAS